MPDRIQRKRTKGWRMPPGTIYVGRPSKWGNPFTKAIAVEAEMLEPYEGGHRFLAQCFREWLLGGSYSTWWQGPESDARRLWMLENIRVLHGKKLCCWCPPGPCHADVLLELANG